MKCSPKIWAKFNPLQRKVWTDMYESFIFEHNFPPDFEGTANKKNREVVAHNLACNVAWAIEIYNKKFISKC